MGMNAPTGGDPAPAAEAAPQATETSQAPAAPVEEGGAATEQTQERSSGSNKNGWLQNWLRGGGRTATTDAPDEAASGEAGEAASPGRTEPKAPAGSATPAQPKAPAPAAPRSILEGDPNEQITLSRGEALKAAQSWKDAEIARENRRNAELAASRANAAQMQELRELADPVTGDPDKLAEAVTRLLESHDVQVASHQRQEEILSNVRDVGLRYDAELLKPLLDELPETIRTKIEDAAPSHLVGLAHRSHLFREGLAALKAQVANETEQRVRAALRRNEAFRKEVLAAARGEIPEPELVPAGAAPSSSPDANTWLRNILKS